MRKTIILILFCLVLIGCNLKKEENIPQKISQNIIEGYSLHDLGLSINLENLKPFIDPNINDNYKRSYEVLHVNDDFDFSHIVDGDINSFGNISVLGILYSDNIISLEFMPALYIQGFKKSVDTEKEQFISVDTKLHNLADLNQYKLYENDNFIVYEVTDLLPIKKFDKKIESLSELSTFDYSYHWMNDVYEYLKSYKDINIY